MLSCQECHMLDIVTIDGLCIDCFRELLAGAVEIDVGIVKRTEDGNVHAEED